MGTLSNRSFQRGNPDDDLFVTLISSDKDAVRLDDDYSVRVYWQNKLPLRLDFKDDEWEVALVDFSCRNREYSQPEVVVQKDDATLLLPLPKRIYEDKIQVVNEALQVLSSQTVTFQPPPAIDFSQEELHIAGHYKNRHMNFFKIQNQHFQKFADERSHHLNSYADLVSVITSATYNTYNPHVYLLRGHTATSDSYFMTWFALYHHTNDLGSHEGKLFHSHLNSTLKIRYSQFDMTIFVTLQLAYHLKMHDQATFDANYSTNATAVLEYSTVSGKDFVIVNFMFQDQPITLTYTGGDPYVAPSRFQDVQGIPLDFALSPAGDTIQFTPLSPDLNIFLAYDPPKYDVVEDIMVGGIVTPDVPLTQVLDAFPSEALPKEVYPAIRLVKVKIYGLNLPQEFAMRGSEEESEALVFCIPLKKDQKTVSYIPTVSKEIYRPIQVKTCNSITVSVEFDDSLTPERLRPNFFVANTSITLKFRQK